MIGMPSNDVNFSGTFNNTGSMAVGQGASVTNYGQQQQETPLNASYAPQQAQRETINVLFVLANPRGTDP